MQFQWLTIFVGRRCNYYFGWWIIDHHSIIIVRCVQREDDWATSWRTRSSGLEKAAGPPTSCWFRRRGEMSARRPAPGHDMLSAPRPTCCRCGRCFSTWRRCAPRRHSLSNCSTCTSVLVTYFSLSHSLSLPPPRRLCFHRRLFVC